MLNSPAVWSAVYDRRVKRRRLEEAVSGMDAYRASKLARPALPPPPTHSDQQSEEESME